jgi:hypothetical protein
MLAAVILASEVKELVARLETGSGLTRTER